jgi:L-histidine N-alpha-methyltransferase
MTTTVLTKPSAATPGSGSRFASEVRHFLTQHPRQLPSHYLYDDLGSALFEAICRLPWYSLTRAELRLLQAQAREILSPGVTTVLELGSGSGVKLSALIESAGSGRGRLDLHIVDVSGSALAQAGQVLGRLENVRVVTHRTTYEAGLEEFGLARPATGRRLALFLGSNIGNFDPPGRDAFLKSVRSALAQGDDLLLGVDLRKPRRDLLVAYDDPLGVTAAFNLNLLARINRELLGNFDLGAFTHRALWNEERSRIEMHLRSSRRQRIAIRGADLDFVMAEGETIWTESSYKYEPPEIVAMLERSGFGIHAQWIDAVDGFALTLAGAV